jgi:hypothetical protein
MNPNVDSGPRLPRQVIAQAAHAHELLKEGVEQPPATPPATPAATAAAAPVTPAPAAFTVEQLLNAPDPTKDADPAYWRARANATEGFRRVDNANNKDRIARLESEVKALKEKNSELAKSHPAVAPTIDLKKHFTEDEIESIGEDRARAILRATLTETEETIRKRIEEAVAPLLERQTKTHEATEAERYQKFVEDLTAGFPTWQVTDSDPRWRSWLNGVDEATGMVRQQIINAHKSDRNAQGIIKLLNAFVTSLAPAPIPQKPPVSPTPLEGTGGDSPLPDAIPDGGWMSEKEIRDGYKRKSLGKMSREEAQKFDARVAAQMAQAGRA